MPQNIGDRIFPYGGSPGGGGSTPGNPDGGAFTPVEQGSINVTSSTFTEGQWAKSFKELQYNGYVHLYVTAGGATSIEFTLPEAPDSAQLFSGFATINGINMTNLVYAITSNGTTALLDFTHLGAGGNTNVNIFLSYKTAA